MTQTTITPWEVTRKCESQPTKALLTLKEVDNKESVYVATTIRLKDSGLPTVTVPVPQSASVPTFETYEWGLCILLEHRQDWEPTGYGLGELVHTLSLLPNEELTLEVKTWETDKRMEEEDTTLEDKKTSDVKDTTSSASEASAKSATQTKEYVDASAGYSGFGASVSVKAGWSEDVQTANGELAKQSSDRTRQAANEERRSKRVKLAVSRESGSESKTTRKIKNINQAHTLNANFYEVIQEFTVSTTLSDVSLVVTGSTARLNRVVEVGGWYPMVNYWEEPDKQTNLKWSELLYRSQDAGWVADFARTYGVSPIKILRAEWSAALRDGAMTKRDYWNSGPLSYVERDDFRLAVLEFVTPVRGWVVADADAELRWGYQVIHGKEEAFLRFLYDYVPYSESQFVALLTATAVDVQAALASVRAGETVRTPLTSGGRVRARGPFDGLRIRDFATRALPAWVSDIMSQYKALAQDVGTRLGVDGQDHFAVTLPTAGIHADLSLGFCSGAEDYYEIQRQFDLELKKLEVEKLKAEVEKLTLMNQAFQQGKPDVLVTSPSAPASVSVNVTAGEPPFSIGIAEDGT